MILPPGLSSLWLRRTLMDPTKGWTAVNLPNLSGRLIVVTGGNSGIGFHAASEFAKKGASVVLACRSIEKARTAARSDNRRSSSGIDRDSGTGSCQFGIGAQFCADLPYQAQN